MWEVSSSFYSQHMFNFHMFKFKFYLKTLILWIPLSFITNSMTFPVSPSPCGLWASSLCLCSYGTCPEKSFLGLFRRWGRCSCRNYVTLSYPGLYLIFQISCWFSSWGCWMGPERRLSMVHTGKALQALLVPKLNVLKCPVWLGQKNKKL